MITAEPLNVGIDIKPGSYPNSINIGSNGVVPVAIFSTAGFDATQIDPVTLTLADADVKLRGKGVPMTSFEDVDGDGLLDLVAHVETEGLVLTGEDTVALLEGQTLAGTAIQGVDSVRVLGWEPLPEPTTMLLLVLGGMAMSVRGTRRRH